MTKYSCWPLPAFLPPRGSFFVCKSRTFNCGLFGVIFFRFLAIVDDRPRIISRQSMVSTKPLDHRDGISIVNFAVN